jgi:GDPmannose 4,6-dehydratase
VAQRNGSARYNPGVSAPKSALVIGISGQDGAYLARLLLDKGYAVIGTSRDAQLTRFDNLRSLGLLERVQLSSMNPHDFRSVFEVVSKVAPQEIYNLSGQSSVAMSFEQPVEALNSILNATVTLLEAIRFMGRPVRLYNAGSSECFGDVRAGLADESTPFRPRSPYAASKAAAHWIVSNYREGYGLFACTGILFNHESPLRPQRFVTRKIAVAAAEIASGRREKLTLGNMDVKRDWGWAPEYVDAMWRMLQQEQPDDYVVATGRLCTLEEFVDAAFAEAGLRWQDHVVVDASLKRPTDLQGFAGDATKAKATLGWQSEVMMPQIARRLVREELRQREAART